VVKGVTLPFVASGHATQRAGAWKMLQGHNAASAVRIVLEEYGVRSAFALAGASQSVLIDELDRHGMRIVQTRHETATVGAADGYARVRRNIGVAIINADQGMANAVTGVQSAFEACSPVVVLVGREPHSWIEPELPVDHDALALLRPVTKWARTCHSAQRLSEYVEIACRKALAGRPGPCVVAYPKDLLTQEVLPGVAAGRPPRAVVRPAPDPAALAEIVSLIDRSERPVIIAGSGAYWSGAGSSLRKFSERFGVPVLMNAMGRGLVPEDNRLGWPWPVAQTAADQADLVIWAGARLSRRFGYGLAPRFQRHVPMVQIDLSAEELSRNRPVDVPLLADVRLSIEQLHAALESNAAPTRDPAWLSEALQGRLRVFLEKAAIPAANVNPYRIGTLLREHLGPDTLLVNDGAVILTRMLGVLRFDGPGSYMDTYPLGSMGMGTPMAIGASIAEQDEAAAQSRSPRRVVLVTGDGSFGFYPSELATAVTEKLRLSIIVANNRSWGNELLMQPPVIGRTLNADLGDINYAAIGQAMGFVGEVVSDGDSLPAALARALASPRPSMLDVQVNETPLEQRELTLLYSDVENTRARHFGGA